MTSYYGEVGPALAEAGGPGTEPPPCISITPQPRSSRDRIKGVAIKQNQIV